MATYTVTEKYLLDNFAVLQLLTPSEIAVGSSIVVSSVDATFNGTVVVRACPQHLFIGIDNQGDLLFDYNVPIENQVLYAKTASNVDRVAASGTVVYNPAPTWITTAQLITYLGVAITNPSDDYTLATQATNAANDFCWRRRQEAGYTGDLLASSPGHDVSLGTAMYAAALWRSRGSVESMYATFDGMGSATQQSLTPIVKQLLGIPRPAVA
jgi:hypothetical protein